MSRTVAHVYKKPDVPPSTKYAGMDWVISNRWSHFFCEAEDLARATTRHVYRYRRNAGDRAVKERPRYLAKKVEPHDYERVVYGRGNRVHVLASRKHSSNRTRDRISSRDAVKTFRAGSQEDLTECFGDHWTHHSAMYDS